MGQNQWCRYPNNLGCGTRQTVGGAQTDDETAKSQHPSTKSREGTEESSGIGTHSQGDDWQTAPARPSQLWSMQPYSQCFLGPGKGPFSSGLGGKQTGWTSHCSDTWADDSHFSGHRTTDSKAFSPYWDRFTTITPPPPPAMNMTHEGHHDIMMFCKSQILPDPKAKGFLKHEKKSLTCVLAAALYVVLERKYFEERTSRSDIASMFSITTAQLTKAVTGVDYESGLHQTKRKRRTDADSTTP